MTSIAEEFHYSPSYLSRTYKEISGESLTIAISNYRLKRAKQLLENVDTICDFRESRLYQHMEFKTAENPYTREMEENLLTLFRDGEDFSYMKGYEPWEKLLCKS